MAFSLASEPELVKKLFFSLPGVIWAIFSAKRAWTSMGKRVLVCCSVRIWAIVRSVISGSQWPTLTVTMPPKKSRYCLPSASVR
ncbi:hypothetical protein D3C78_1867430 [compost metagenome]